MDQKLGRGKRLTGNKPNTIIIDHAAISPMYFTGSVHHLTMGEAVRVRNAYLDKNNSAEIQEDPEGAYSVYFLCDKPRYYGQPVWQPTSMRKR